MFYISSLSHGQGVSDFSPAAFPGWMLWSCLEPSQGQVSYHSILKFLPLAAGTYIWSSNSPIPSPPSPIVHSMSLLLKL